MYISWPNDVNKVIQIPIANYHAMKYSSCCNATIQKLRVKKESVNFKSAF